MSVRTVHNIAPQLADCAGELNAMAQTVDNETIGVARGFEKLAGQSDAILSRAAAIVGCVEDDKVTSVLPRLQALGVAAKDFIAERLQASSGILETVATEARVLRQLSDVASSQEAVALEIKVLSVLTNIEVARLGSIGAGFQYLAHELSAFSTSVLEDTQELVSHADRRQKAIEATRRLLAAELPRLRGELGRIDAGVEHALAAVASSLGRLSDTPAHFRKSVEDISSQVAGVVAALQSQDITRQMNEHVQHALLLIAQRFGDAEQNDTLDRDLPQIYAGLSIQIYQLRNLKETVSRWVAQIRICLDAILKVSTSDLDGLGTIVLEQEEQVSSQLSRIEGLERESELYSERIRHTLAGLSNLVQTVGEHLQRSKTIRDRLRMLAFNSIIEASHLGSQADVILAISKSIKEVSVSWSLITGHSEEAMREILALVAQSSEVTRIFSTANSEKLREAQMQSKTGLSDLRSAAEFAAAQAQDMNTVTTEMKARLFDIRRQSDSLDRSFATCDTVLNAIAALKQELEAEDPALGRRYDPAEAEQLFAATYTTELEREVLRAALSGAPLPVEQPALAGNSIELF